MLAHSDVAPSRKQDPGEKFPWRLLAQSGVGLWVEPAPIAEGEPLKPGDTGDEGHRAAEDAGRIRLRHRRHRPTTTPPPREVVTAFQRHFRPAQVDGIADASTLQTLRKLLVARDSAAEARRAIRSLPAPKALQVRPLTAAVRSPIP